MSPTLMLSLSCVEYGLITPDTPYCTGKSRPRAARLVHLKEVSTPQMMLMLVRVYGYGDRESKMSNANDMNGGPRPDGAQ